MTLRNRQPEDAAGAHPDEARTQEIYDDINARAAAYADFDLAQLVQSRQYFDLSARELPTRAFDVLTCVAGLPIPESLQRVMMARLDQILSVASRSVRVYRVRPDLLHWECHIIRRPGEPAPPLLLERIAELFAEAVTGASSFDLTLRGFFVSPDGTIAFQGFGPTSDLRTRLRSALPFSSPRQNDTGHISVARILDPLGTDNFARLLSMQRASEDETFGQLEVDQIKLISEERWYMEAYRPESSALLCKRSRLDVADGRAARATRR